MRNYLSPCFRKKSSLLILCLALSTTFSYAQEADPIIKAGDAHFDNEDYFRASNFYLKALEREPNNISAKYKLAESYRLITNYQTAENFYEEVLRRSENRFPLARYYYAVTQKFNGKYREALGNFELFIKNVERKQYTRLRGAALITFSEQARIDLEGCLMALEELEQNRLNHNFHILGEPVNTIFNDYAAYTYHNDSSIVITSARLESKGTHLDNKFGESLTDLFRFEYKDGNWSAIERADKFDREINTKYHDGSGVFNRDFSKLYFTHCAEDEGCKIYVSNYSGKEWQEPKPLNTNINKKDSDSMHPALTSAGDTLFFTSDRPGGLGGFDIWMSVSVGGESWKPAQNLGDYINTAFREVSPFYDFKGNTLFFSSDGHIGHGGLDIYMAENIFDASSPVFNMGLPFNSSSDDAFFILGEIGGYLSSNRQGGIGNFDIYSFQIDSDSEIITEIIASKKEASRNSIFVTDYTFDNPDIEMVEAVVSNLLASRLHNTNLPFSVKEQEFYDQLSEADRIRIERIVSSRMMSTQLANLQTVRHEDEFFYQQVAGDFKHHVDRMVNYYLEDFEMANISVIPEEDKAFYENLNSNSKGSIDRYIALKLNEYEDLDLNDEYYSSLPTGDQNSIDNISETFLKSKTNLSSLNLSNADASFLSALDEDDRARTELAISNQVAVVSSQANYKLKDTDKDFFENLSGTGKNSLNNMAQAYLEGGVHNIEQFFNPEDLDYFKSLKPNEKEAFDKLLAKRIQNFVKADNYALDALNPTELSEVIALQLAEQGTLEDFLADSSIQENSILKIMAKEDQKRFSRLLASAATLVMTKSSTRVKSTALDLEKKLEIKRIIEETTVNSQELPSVQYYSALTSKNQALFQDVLVRKLLPFYSDTTEQFNLRDEGNLKAFQAEIVRELTSDSSSLNSLQQQIIKSLDGSERQTLADNIVAFSQHLGDQQPDVLRSVALQNQLNPATLATLKAPPAIMSDFTSSLSGLNLDSNAGTGTNTGSESSSSSLLPSSPNSLPPEKASRISSIISSIKRQFGQKLPEDQLAIYSSMTPAEKRFIDQALNSELQKYVLANDPILSLANDNSDANLESSLTQKLNLTNFRRDPKLRRSFATIQNRSEDQKAALNEFLIKNAKLIFEINGKELQAMAIQAPTIQQNTSQTSTRVAERKAEIKASPEIQKLVVSTKPDLIKNLTASQLQDYMRLGQTDKDLIDNTISEKIQSYVTNSDPILAYNNTTDASSKAQLDEKIDVEFAPTQLEKDHAPIEISLSSKSEEEKSYLSNLLARMTKVVLNKNGDQLRSMVPKTSSSATSAPNAILNTMDPSQLEIYNQMSAEEKGLLENLMAKTLNSSSLNLSSGTRTGQVVTIQIMESDKSIDLEGIKDQLKLIGPNQFKAGETLKLVWSEAQQTWYEIARSED